MRVLHETMPKTILSFKLGIHFKILLVEIQRPLFLKMGQSRPLFVYFRSFHIPIQMANIQFEQ